MLRTTDNKIYRQEYPAIPRSWRRAFRRAPRTCSRTRRFVRSDQSKPTLFHAGPARRLIREVRADRRGGGLLLLGGRFSLADGGWGGSVESRGPCCRSCCPTSMGTFHRRARDGGARCVLPAWTTTSRGLVDDSGGEHRSAGRSCRYLMDYPGPGHTRSPAPRCLPTCPGPGEGTCEDADVAGHRKLTAAAAPRCSRPRAPGAGR